MVSQTANHVSFTLDRDMLGLADSYVNNGNAESSPAALKSITFETYKYHSPAFYIPEEMHELVATYNAAGWKHLVNANATPAQQASPTGNMTDLWLHYKGTRINDVTVLVRAPKAMTVIEVSGELRPLDLVHLSGHFGIPKVDPNAVMVPAAPGQ
jgi:hypothetical protein